MKTFYAPLSELAGIEQLKKDFEVTGQPVMISGCIDTQKIHLVHAAVNDYRFRLIITGDEAKAREMQEDSRFFDKSSIYYPAKDFIFYSADVHGNQLAGERLRCIQKIIAAQDNKTNITVITTIDGCVDMLMPLQRYRDNIIHFKNSDIIDTEKLISKLVGIGYTRVPMIDGQGQFAVRGGIIDIFSYTDETPVRIELWDDEIDSIRFFDVESQRSVEKIQTYDVFPATEWILSEDEIDAGFEKVKDEELEKWISLFRPLVSRVKFKSQYEQAVALLVGHKLKLAGYGTVESVGGLTTVIAALSNSGVSSVSEGETSVSMDTTAGTLLSSGSADAEFGKTVYGLQFVSLRRQMVMSIAIDGSGVRSWQM